MKKPVSTRKTDISCLFKLGWDWVFENQRNIGMQFQHLIYNLNLKPVIDCCVFQSSNPVRGSHMGGSQSSTPVPRPVDKLRRESDGGSAFVTPSGSGGAKTESRSARHKRVSWSSITACLCNTYSELFGMHFIAKLLKLQTNSLSLLILIIMKPSYSE